MSVPTPSTIVVPLDGSEFSTRAIPAATVVRAGRTGITLVGVATDDRKARVAVPTHARSHRAVAGRH